MQNPSINGCFFLDTNIIISEIMEQNITRIEQMKKNVDRYQIPCYFSDSVKTELKQKMENTIDYVGEVIRTFLRGTLVLGKEKRGSPRSSPITSEDIVELDKSFSLLHNQARVRSYLTQPLAIIEEWALKFLEEKIDAGTNINIDHFIKELLNNILNVVNKIQIAYDEMVTLERSYAKKITISIDPLTENHLRSIGIHYPDTSHIASAFHYKIVNNQKTVFVTLDYHSIISKRDEIKNKLNISCCDPLYSIHHLTT